MMNPLKTLGEFSQAVWLDDIHRDLMTSGRLRALLEEDGLCGMTSNPAIFQHAISSSDDYDEEVATLMHRGSTPEEIVEALSVTDVRMAADVFAPLYRQSEGRHGFVSIEVSPRLARDTAATIEEAFRLWNSVGRPNVFIKVPATLEGLPAITRLLADGVNVNVTLLFGLDRYREVADAFLQGMEERVRRDLPVDRVRSVASFFLSRIDVLLDPRLEKIAGQADDRASIATALRGQVAIASAKTAYAIYEEITSSARWRRLAARGVHPQWLLWASTGTKNPEYSDVKYVEELIGPRTVSTMPMETLDAYRDHGEPRPRLTEGLDEARRTLEQLAAVGIDLARATQTLEDEGIEKFRKPYDSMIDLFWPGGVRATGGGA